jgi:P27 family predicted phage terminase small subunit
MRGGQNRKPTRLKLAEGTVDKSRLKPAPKKSATAPKTSLRCPFPAKSIAAKKWREVLRGLEKFGIVDEIDAAHLEGFAAAYQLAKEADALVAREGMMVAGSMGQAVKHPALAVSSDAWNKVRHYGNDLGLTYLSRTRMDGTEKGKQDDIEARYFG